MPNHVANVVKMKGISELPLFKIDDDGEKSFDFNKIIPMPESLDVCSGSITDECIVCYLTQKGTVSIENLKDFDGVLLRKLVKNYFGGEGWPEEVLRRVRVKMKEETEENKDEMYRNGEVYVSNYLKYGYTTWYDWCYANWGTKWNAYRFDFIDEDTIRFETAWSNPEPVMRKLSEMYPEVEIEHWWADECIGSNTGYTRFLDGISSSDFCDEDSEEAEENYEFCWSF